MMKKDKVNKIKSLIWQDDSAYNDSQVYVILDAARDKNIFIGLMNSDEEYVCLYKGSKKAKELETCAPYLVKLERSNSFTDWILQYGWGNSWGIFCKSDLDIQKVRDHFREFLMVVNEEGDPMYFRFYDPRVMRVFLPTSDQEQLDIMFGPIEKYIVEERGGESAIDCSIVEGSLAVVVCKVG